MKCYIPQNVDVVTLDFKLKSGRKSKFHCEDARNKKKTLTENVCRDIISLLFKQENTTHRYIKYLTG